MSASDSSRVSCLLTFRGMEKIKLKCKLGIPAEESGLQSAIPFCGSCFSWRPGVFGKSDKLL